MALDDSYTKSLLHFDGADASTTFTDESGKVWTVVNQAQIDTAQSKFGGASGLFDGASDHITTPATTDFQYGWGDFTIDMWARINATGTLIIFNQGGVEGSKYPDILFESISKTQTRLRIWQGATLKVDETSATVTEDAFNHFAIIRSGNTFYLAANGVLSAGDNVGIEMDYDATVPLDIGLGQNSNPIYSFNGWVDEFRISKGIARWTADFTPPTRAYGTPAFTSEIMWFM